jgi:hypothetical protein
MNPELLINIPNEMEIDSDGWAQIAPMGDFPGIALVEEGQGQVKRVPALQRIDREAVANMVRAFHEERKGLRRFLRGCPIYVGHPDVPEIGARYPDKSPKGVFADLAERGGAFCGMPVFTNEGSELVETRRYRALSGRWLAEPCGEAAGKDGRTLPVFRPTRLLSAGLTNQPNLPVQLLNEARAEQSLTTLMKGKIITLCGTAGVTLANDATDEQIAAALEQLASKAASAATLANEKSSLEAAAASLASERDAARAEFAGERAAHIEALLNAAIGAGRIAAAEREGWAARLGNAAGFANEAAALTAQAPQLKTRSVTITRGERKIEIANAEQRRALVQELVREAMAAGPLDYDTAFARVQRSHPALFEAMAGTRKLRGGR